MQIKLKDVAQSHTSLKDITLCMLWDYLYLAQNFSSVPKNKGKKDTNNDNQ